MNITDEKIRVLDLDLWYMSDEDLPFVTTLSALSLYFFQKR
jgi:hypothetical protein